MLAVRQLVKCWLLFVVIPAALTFLDDPYKILGVDKKSDAAAIKRAYKRLAKQWHPDKNPTDEAKNRFVEIGGAYELLSDPERRQRYDMYGQTEDQPNFRAPRPKRPFNGLDPDELFGAGGFRFTFRAQASAAAVLFHRHAVTLRHYENRLLADSRTRPTLLLVYSEWCFACVQMEPVWAILVDELEKIGIGIATVHSEQERQLARKLNAADSAPQLMLLLDGRLFQYRRQEYGFKMVVDFIRTKMLPDLVMPLNDANVDQFLSDWTDNRVRIVIYGQTEAIKLRYASLAFKYRVLAATGYVFTGAADSSALVKRHSVSTRAETLNVFKETQPNGGDVPPVAASLSMEQLPFATMRDVMEKNRFLMLPRLSSQPMLDWLCPVESSRSRRHLCAVLMAHSGADLRAPVFASLRHHVIESRLRNERLHYAYLFVDKQTPFWQSLQAGCPQPADPAGHVVIFWRQSHDTVLYEWMQQRWRANSDVSAAVETNGSSGQRLERRLRALLSSSDLLPHQSRGVPELKDEHAHGVLRRVLIRVYYAFDYIYDRVSRDEVVPAVSVAVTIVFLVAGGYLMSHLVKLEEANIQRQYREQGGAAGGGSVPASAPQLRIHELRGETFNGLIRLLKPGCRTLVLMVDADSRTKLVAQFRRIVWPYRKNKTLMFACLLLERGLEWYKRLLLPHLPENNRQLNINPKNCIGTVLSINGHRKYFCMYHAKHAEAGPRGAGAVARRRAVHKRHGRSAADFLGFDSSGAEDSGSNSSDVERGGTKTVGEDWGVGAGEILFEEHLLDGLPDWLDRLFEGQTVRYHLNYWPDFIGK